MENNALDKTFGKQVVEPNVREKLIREVFNKVAPRYDLMNDAMSFGIHRFWKSKLVRLASPQKNQTIIDLAGGTGDVAIKLSKHCDNVLIAEPSLAMMQAGLKRHKLLSIGTTGELLPFVDNSIDTLTISFGIRNTTHMQKCLQEINRVLKPGGRLLCLEFSQPAWWLKPFYDVYSYYVIPRLGASIAGEPEAYTYLIESIRKFPDQREMQSLLESVGFTKTSYKNLSFGIACIHIGSKE